MKGMPVRQVAERLSLTTESEAVVSGYEVDSRRIGPGDLFFALPGEKTDGHQYLTQGQAQGALGAVVSRTYAGPDHGLELLRVDNVLSALHELARRAASETKAKIVGITGSVGKTTTKEFTSTLLEGKFRV